MGKYSENGASERSSNEKKLKKKIGKKVALAVIVIFGPAAALLGGLLIFIFMIGGPERFMPDMDPDMLIELQTTATNCGVSWEELLAYVTVYYENDFTTLDIDSVVADFLLIRYEKLHEEVETKKTKVPVSVARQMGYQYSEVNNGMVDVEIKSSQWILDGTFYLEDPDSIYRFAQNTGLQSYSGIGDVVEHIRTLGQTDAYNTYISNKDTRDFFDQLTADQQEWYNVLISENLIQVAAGTYYELPKEIIVQTSGYFAWPVPGVTRITSPFGWRLDPVYGGKASHKGVDAADVGILGKPIIAAATGKVSDVQYKTTGYGYNVTLEHVDEDGHTWQTRYCHMNQIVVEIGEQVTRGHVIGAVGNTGKSTGPHIHFEVKYEGTNVDPLLLMTPN